MKTLLTQLTAKSVTQGGAVSIALALIWLISGNLTDLKKSNEQVSNVMTQVMFVAKDQKELLEKTNTLITKVDAHLEQSAILQKANINALNQVSALKVNLFNGHE